MPLEVIGINKKMTEKVLNLLLILGASALATPVEKSHWGPAEPSGPQGPPGAVFAFDLLSNSWGHIGAFQAESAPPYAKNNEKQEYTPSAISQNPGTGEITITAKNENGKITSGSINTKGIWSTSQAANTKKRGYLEVRATLPAKPNSRGNFGGSWPAIWMMGQNKYPWPNMGEIDIVEVVNGDPSVVESLHSPAHHGGNPQHPPNQPVRTNANLNDYPLIAGMEWNIQDNGYQLDLTWWMTWYDEGSGQWKHHHTTKPLFHGQNMDYHTFYDAFMNGGFYLRINLAEGGDMPQDQSVFPDGQPQYIRVKSAKVYGF